MIGFSLPFQYEFEINPNKISSAMLSKQIKSRKVLLLCGFSCGQNRKMCKGYKKDIFGIFAYEFVLSQFSSNSCSFQ